MRSTKQTVSPPAPSSAQSEAPTGPAPVASESPAPSRTPDAAPPHADHAAVPETPTERAFRVANAKISLPPSRSVANDAMELAVELEAAAKEMADDGTDGASLRMIIGCVASAHRLAGLLAAGARA